MSDKVSLVRVLTSATGNSTPITLGARYSDLFMTPADAGAVDGRTYTWLIVDGNNWELVKGVYTASGTTAARTTVLASRNAGTLGTSRITLSGTAQVRIVESAVDMDGVRGTRSVTGTSDALASTDLGYVVTYSNAAAVAVSLAQAGTASLYDGWATWVQNLGVGTVTITPATSTINGASTLVLPTGHGAFIWSDGTNYHAYFVANLAVYTSVSFLGDVNTLITGGMFVLNGASTNQPVASTQYYVFVQQFPGTAGGYVQQTAWDLSPNGGMWTRGRVAGSWSAWVPILNAGPQSLTAAQAAQGRTNIVAQAQGDFAGMSNGTLTASASAGALTVAVKTFAGADPSSSDPVYFYFRDNTLGNGDFTRIAVTAALSVVLGSTKTLGATSGNGTRIWLGAFNNAGTVQLAAINCSDTNGVFAPQEYVKYTTAVPASASKAWYSTSAIGTAAPWRLIGYCEWNSLTTAGTWVVPDMVQLFGAGISRPGTPTGTVAFAATTTGANPSSASFSSALSTSITLASAANKVRVSSNGTSFSANGLSSGYVTLYRGTVATQLTSQRMFNTNVNPIYVPAGSKSIDSPNTVGAITYGVGVAGDGTNTCGWGTSGSSGNFGTLELEELMG